jgi:hypothetical protein
MLFVFAVLAGSAAVVAAVAKADAADKAAAKDAS